MAYGRGNKCILNMFYSSRNYCFGTLLCFLILNDLIYQKYTLYLCLKQTKPLKFSLWSKASILILFEYTEAILLFCLCTDIPRFRDQICYFIILYF